MVQVRALQIPIDTFKYPGPHHFQKPDPDPQQSEKLGPDSKSGFASKFKKIGAVAAQNGAVESGGL
jgi:hypothetical protein